MRLLIAALGFAVGLAATGAQAETAISYPVYVLGSVGGGLGVVDHEVTVISRVDLPIPDRQVIWIAERRRRNQKIREWIIDHQWLDGRTCPALVLALEELRRLPAMQFGSPTTMADASLAFDVPLSILLGPPAGPLTRKDGVGVQLGRQEYMGPVADWRMRMEKSIAGCWQDAPVVIPGAEVVERLGTKAKAEAWLR